MATHIWRLSTTFAALRHREFRWLWLGQLASSATFEMGTVAQGWLIYQLTDSAFALGWVSAGWSLSTLILSLYGGALTDRMEKRTLLLWTRAGMLANSVLVAVLISLGAVRVWHLAASSLFTGLLFAFLMPAQQAIISELVDRATLLNALSLQALGMGLMGIFSASLAGLLIESVGVQGVYYLMAGLYLLSVFTNSRLPITGRGRPSGSLWGDLAAGLRYLRASPVLLALLGIALVRVLLVMPYRTLMPAYARDHLGFDASGLGLLMAAPGLGALAASLTLCSLGNPQGKGRLLLAAGLVMGLSLVCFVALPFLPTIFLFLALLGASNNIAMVMNSTLLQSHCEACYRGRVLSVYMMLWGLTPLGTVPAGALADRVGVPPVVSAQGALVILVSLAIGLLRPEVKKLE